MSASLHDNRYAPAMSGAIASSDRLCSPACGPVARKGGCGLSQDAHGMWFTAGFAGRPVALRAKPQESLP